MTSASAFQFYSTILDTEYGPAEDDAALHRLLHEVRGECGEGGVHDEGHQEHEDREPGDRDQGEGEGGVEPDRLPRRPGRGLLLLLLGQRLNKVIPSFLHPITLCTAVWPLSCDLVPPNVKKYKPGINLVSMLFM